MSTTVGITTTVIAAEGNLSVSINARLLPSLVPKTIMIST